MIVSKKQEARSKKKVTSDYRLPVTGHRLPVTSRRKLLITSDCSLPRWDGIARFLHEIIPELTKTYRVTVAVPEFAGDVVKQKDVSYVRFALAKRAYGDIQFAQVDKKKIKDLVRKSDVVFNQTKRPIIHYVHSIDWELASRSVLRARSFVYHTVRLLVRRLYNRCTLVLVPSRSVEDSITQNKVVVKKVLVPMGVDTARFKPSKNKEKSKQQVGLSSDIKLIGYVGRIAREKDLPTLYRAFKIVQQTRNDVKLLVVGSGIAGEIPSEDPDVIFTGAQQNVVPYLQALDAFVLPSLTETSSLATMEAMSCALPVIVTPVGNIPEYVEDGMNGLLFARFDHLALARHISTVLSNQELAQELGARARETIVKRYSWKKTVTKIKKVLESVQ